MIYLFNTVLGDMEDVYYKAWCGVASVDFSCNNNREQTVARGSSIHPACGITCIDEIWLPSELSSYASLKCGWVTPDNSAQTIIFYI